MNSVKREQARTTCGESGQAICPEHSRRIYGVPKRIIEPFNMKKIMKTKVSNASNVSIASRQLSIIRHFFSYALILSNRVTCLSPSNSVDSHTSTIFFAISSETYLDDRASTLALLCALANFAIGILVRLLEHLFLHL